MASQVCLANFESIISTMLHKLCHEWKRGTPSKALRGQQPSDGKARESPQENKVHADIPSERRYEHRRQDTVKPPVVRETQVKTTVRRTLWLGV